MAAFFDEDEETTLSLKACILTDKEPHESIVDQIYEASIILVDAFRYAEYWDLFYDKISKAQRGI